MPGVKNFPANERDSAFSHVGRDFGNPMLNLMMSFMLGQNMMPQVDEGQDMYDAFIQRQRSQHFMSLQRSGAANNMLFKSLGVGDNSAVRAFSSMAMNSPESGLGRFLSPLMGGNPMAASMQLYGGLTGMNVMGNFGRASNITQGETEASIEGMMNALFKSQAYEGPGGVREESNKRAQQKVLDLAKDNKNDNYLKSIGINVERTESGDLTEKFKEEVGKFEVAGPSYADPEEKAKEMHTSDQLRRNVFNRRVASSKLEEALDEVINLSEEDKTRDEKVKKLKEKASKELSLTSKAADDMFSKKSLEKGGKEAREAITSYATPTELEERAEATKGFAEAGKKYKGIDFEKTRGFKVEDFTSGFTRAAGLRAMGETRGRSIAGASEEFAQNAGGALSAARSVFGNKSGAELVSKISDITGDTLDLRSAGGAGEAEKLLRDVKATADVAGISIKTMLGVIDATKELASSNPRLAAIGAQSTTKMAISTVTRATEVASAMGAKEFRQAGGEQGITSSVAREKNAFMASSFAQQMAGVYTQVKGIGNLKDANGNEYDPTKRLEEAIASGKITPETIASGEAQKIVSEITQGKVNATGFAMGGIDKSAQAHGMRQEGLTTALDKGLQSVVENDIWANVERATEGKMTKEKYYARVAEENKKRASGDKSAKTAVDILKEEVGTTAGVMGNEPLQARLETYQTAITQGAREAAMTPEQREQVKKRQAERADLAAKLDKEFAGNYHDIGTQVVGALLEGKSFEETAGMIGDIFATKDTKKKEVSAALQKAQESAADISSITKQAGGNQEKYKELGITEKLNSFIAGRKVDAAEQGVNADYLSSNITTKEFEQEMQELKHSGVKTTKEAQTKLEELEGLESSGKITDAEKGLLGALRTAKKAGHLESDEAFSLAKKGTWKDISAATIQGQSDFAIRNIAEKEKKGVVSKLTEQLGAEADTGGVEVNKIIDFYSKQLGVDSKDPAIAARILEDYQNPKKRGESNYFGKAENLKSAEEDPTLGSILGGARESLGQIEEAANKGKAKEAAKDSTKDLKDAVDKLVASITDGGGIGKPLEQIATALSKIR